MFSFLLLILGKKKQLSDHYSNDEYSENESDVVLKPKGKHFYFTNFKVLNQMYHCLKRYLTMEIYPVNVCLVLSRTTIKHLQANYLYEIHQLVNIRV